jgi:hypothetical protein
VATQTANTALGVGQSSDATVVPTNVSSASVEGDEGPVSSKTDLGTKLKYDTTTMMDESETKLPKSHKGSLNKPLSPGQRANLAETNRQLDEGIKKTFKGGVTFDPPFNPPDSADAAEAKNAILQRVDPENGSEQGRVLNLNGVKTLATADVDKNGKATVKILGPGQPGVPDSAKFADLASAKKALADKYGVKVSDSPKEWTKEELESANAAFSTLSPEEKKALKDVELQRVTEVPDHPERSAQFNHDVEAGPPPTYTKSIQVARTNLWATVLRVTACRLRCRPSPTKPATPSTPRTWTPRVMPSTWPIRI